MVDCILSAGTLGSRDNLFDTIYSSEPAVQAGRFGAGKRGVGRIEG